MKTFFIVSALFVSLSALSGNASGAAIGVNTSSGGSYGSQALARRVVISSSTGSGVVGVMEFSTTSSTTGFNTYGSTYFPQKQTPYQPGGSIVVGGPPVPLNFTGLPGTVWYRWATGGPVYSFEWELPDSVLTVTRQTPYGSGSGTVSALPPFEITLTPGSGTQVITSPEDLPTPVPTTLDKFFGKDLAVPYYVQGDADTVEVKIGDKTYTFPVDRQDGDSGGVAMLNIPIPNGWDGSAEINGTKVALAPRVVYTGEPTMPFGANPYGPPYPDNLPKGMSRGIANLPSGMTPGSHYGLPAGVTESTTLPLPPGVTAVGTGPSVAGNLTSYVTKGGSTIWTSTPKPAVSTGSTTGGGSPGVVGGSGTKTEGQGSTGSDEGDAAVIDGSMGAIGDEIEPGAGMSGYATQWDSLKTQVSSKLGAFRPLQSGSLPRATTLAMTLNLGPFGSRNVSFDLTQEPFVTARAIALVFVTLWAGMWFFKFAKI